MLNGANNFRSQTSFESWCTRQNHTESKVIMVPYQIWLFRGLSENVHHRPIPSLRHSRIWIFHLYTSFWIIIYKRWKNVSNRTWLWRSTVKRIFLHSWSSLISAHFAMTTTTITSKLCTAINSASANFGRKISGFSIWIMSHDMIEIKSVLSKSQLEIPFSDLFDF